MKVAHIYAYSKYYNMYDEEKPKIREVYLEVPRLDLKEVLSSLKERIDVDVDYDFLKEKLDSIDLRVFGECPIAHHQYTLKIIVYCSGYYDEEQTDIIVISDNKEVAKELIEKLKESESFREALIRITDFIKEHNLEVDVFRAEKEIDEGEFYYIISSLKKY